MWLDRSTRYFLFLFPVFAVAVRHWLSGFFGLLVILGFINLIRRYRTLLPLYKEEKQLLAILLGFFAVFLISSSLSGWGKSGTYALGTELRFLLIIPVYLLVRTIEDSARYLLAGSILAALAGGVQALIDVYFLGDHFATGIYGHLFLGPITLLMAALLIPAASMLKPDSKRYRIILFLMLVVAVWGVMLSTARSAYLGFVVLGVILTVYYMPRKRSITSITFLFVLVLAAYFSVDKIQNRIDLAAKEVRNYYVSIQEHPGEPDKYAMGSVGMRLEMWRATQYFFKEAPWFGVGRFNYPEKIKSYVEQGLVNDGIANTPHAHNLFIHMLDEKGIFGLMTALLLLYYPLYIFIKYRSANRDVALGGIILVSAITVFSLTEAAPFVKNNFVAIYLVYMSVFFSSLVRDVHRAGIAPQQTG